MIQLWVTHCLTCYLESFLQWGIYKLDIRRFWNYAARACGTHAVLSLHPQQFLGNHSACCHQLNTCRSMWLTWSLCCHFLSSHEVAMGPEDGSAVKHTCCFCWRPIFSSYNLQLTSICNFSSRGPSTTVYPLRALCKHGTQSFMQQSLQVHKIRINI